MRIKNWSIFSFIAGYHVLLFGLLPFAFGGINTAAIIFCLVGWAIAGFSITAGYHRLFAHSTFKAHPIYEFAVLAGSMLAVQASALQWSHDHRLHHSHVDTDKDPYSIKKGFWYAHVWWLFDYSNPIKDRLVADLLKNPMVVFQHKHYALLMFATNAAIWGIGCLFMAPLTSFVVAVLLRVFLIHHCTWFINSLCHVWGSRTYCKELSAVDNAALAVLTFGEGYHNYHHTIANDYRNGIRWYHFDPTKWIIWTCSKIGLTSDLRWVNDLRLRQTLVNEDKKLFLSRLSHELDEKTAEFRKKVEELSALYDEKTRQLAVTLKHLQEATEEKRAHLKVEVKALQLELRTLWNDWLTLSEFATANYSLAH